MILAIHKLKPIFFSFPYEAEILPKAHVEKISKELHVLRMDDDQVRYFEALWRIEEGITYNAYLLMGSDDVILFDTWKRDYASDLLELLRKPRFLGRTGSGPRFMGIRLLETC